MVSERDEEGNRTGGNDDSIHSVSPTPGAISQDTLDDWGAAPCGEEEGGQGKSVEKGTPFKVGGI